MDKNYLTHYVSAILLILLGLLIITISLMALTPPVVRDELIHHLAVPKLYLQHGGIYEIPFMEWSYFPMNLDLLYMIPLYFGNDIAPKFIHFAFALLTAWLVFHYLRSRTSKNHALFGALFFLSIPLIVKLSITAYIDLAEVFFSFASLYMILEWINKNYKFKYLFWAGVLCGLALGTKYNGLVTFAVLSLVIPFIFSRYNTGKYVSFLRPAILGLVFMCVSMAVFSPWMIRNIHWTGNPIYPLYNQAFNPLQPDENLNDSLLKSRSDKNIGIFTYRRVVYDETGLEIALLPARIFFQGSDDDPQYFDGKLNPFLLLFTVLAFYRIKDDPEHMKREKKILLAFSVFFFSIAFFSTGLRLRYISPIIPPMVVLSAFGLFNLITLTKRLKVVIPEKAGVHNFSKSRGLGFCPDSKTVLAINFDECDNYKGAGQITSKLLMKTLIIIATLIPCCALFLNAEYIYGLYKKVDPVPYITREISRDEYIERHIPEYPAVQYINKNLDPHAKILFIYTGKRGYYCDREYILDDDFEILKKAIGSAVNPGEITGGMKNARITHMLINYILFREWIKNNLSLEKQALTRAWFNDYVQLLFKKNGFGVLAI